MMLGIVQRSGVDYGFIVSVPTAASDEAVEGIFFHRTHLVADNGGRPPMPPVGARVEFEMGQGEKGPRAKHVRVIVDESAIVVDMAAAGT